MQDEEDDEESDETELAPRIKKKNKLSPLRVNATMIINFINSIIILIIITLTSSYPVIVAMYTISLYDVRGLIPPCKRILLPDNDKRVKS